MIKKRNPSHMANASKTYSNVLLAGEKIETLDKFHLSRKFITPLEILRQYTLFKKNHARLKKIQLLIYDNEHELSKL